MTRYKLYLKSKGHKLECDYPCMPYDANTKPVLEGVYTWYNEKKKCIIICNHYVVGCEFTRYYSDGTVDQEFK